MGKKDSDRPATPADGMTGDEAPDAVGGDSATSSARTYVGTGFYWPAIIGALFAAAIVIMVFQNTAPVQLQWLFFDIEAPLVVVLLVTVLITALATELAGWSWRRKRRRVLTERAELKQLKKS